MSGNWQTWTALGVVALAVLFLTRGIWRRRARRGGSCGSGGCGPSGCAPHWKPPRPAR